MIIVKTLNMEAHMKKQVLQNLQIQKWSQSQTDMQKDTNGQIVTDLS